MGHSITCNFQCTVNLSNSSKFPIYGAMTIKDIKGILLSEKEYPKTKGNEVVKIDVFAQTKTGQKYMKGKDFMIMDNNGKLDYYNIGEPMPFNPLGFGQYCGNVADNYWNVAYGYSWRKGCNKRLLNRRIKFAIEEFKKDCDHIGRQIEFSDLPKYVQQFAKQSFEVTNK